MWMQDRIKTIIRDWLNETFGNPQALPGPVLDGLADVIDRHSWEIYRHVMDQNDLEDIEYVTEDMGVELTAKEKSIALHKYQDIEDTRLDSLRCIIDYILEDRERSDDSERRENATTSPTTTPPTTN